MSIGKKREVRADEAECSIVATSNSSTFTLPLVLSLLFDARQARSLRFSLLLSCSNRSRQLAMQYRSMTTTGGLEEIRQKG